MLDNNLKFILSKTIFKIITFINKFTHKDNIVLIYSNSTGGFRDNLKAVYDYMAKTKLNNKYQIYCSLVEYRDFEGHKNVKAISNIKAIYYFLFSKYVFYGYGKLPIKPSKNQIVISMFHGMPLKKIGGYLSNTKVHDYFFTYALASGNLFVPIIAKAFYCPLEKIMICGYPRNDALFGNENYYQKNSKKLILWLPTYRDYKPDYLPVFNLSEIEKLDKLISKLNIILLIKLHESNTLNSFRIPKFKNIVFYKHSDFMKEKLDLYKLLSCADALITDYSSVYFDYLLLDRPIAFTLDDLKMYESDRGFVFDNIFEYMPGKKIHNQDEFFDFCKEIANGVDDYKQERKRVNDLVNYYKDGNNCERLLKIIGIEKKE